MRNHTEQMRSPLSCKPIRNYPLSVATLFPTLLIVLIAGAALARMGGPSHESAKPGARDAERVPSSWSWRNIPGAVPTDPGPLIFLPAVASTTPAGTPLPP
jgi:hypothetical protein